MMKNMMIDCLSWLFEITMLVAMMFAFLLAVMVKFTVLAAIQVATFVFCFVVDSVYDIVQAVKTVVFQRLIINQEVPQEPPQEPAQYDNEPVIEKKKDQAGLLFPSFVKVKATGDHPSNKSRKKSSKAARWTNNKKKKIKSPSPSQEPTGTDVPVKKEGLAAAAANEEKAAPGVSYHQAHNVPLPVGDDTELVVHWAHLIPLPDGDDADLFVSAMANWKRKELDTKPSKSNRNKKRIDAKTAGMKFTGKRDETEFETEGRSQKRKRGNNSGKLGVARPVSFFDDDDD